MPLVGHIVGDEKLNIRAADAVGSINTVFVHQNIIHEFFQSSTGNDDNLGCFCRLHLPDIQRVVMQTADFLGNKAGDRQRISNAILWRNSRLPRTDGRRKSR